MHLGQCRVRTPSVVCICWIWGVLCTLMLLRLTSVKEPSLVFILCRVSSTFVGLGGSSNTGFIFSPLITSTRKRAQTSGSRIQISQETCGSLYDHLLLKPSLAEVPSYVWLLVTRVWTPKMAASRKAAVSEQRLPSLKGKGLVLLVPAVWQKKCITFHFFYACYWQSVGVVTFLRSQVVFPPLTCEVTQLRICGTGQRFL